ncbi:MAG: ABC transporter permease subunit, partial [Pseudomonadota bacterium]
MTTLRPVLWAVLALGLWQALPASVLISSPGAIAAYAYANAPLLARAATETTLNAAQGFAWGNLAAIALGATIMVAPRSERALSALALLIFCVPLIASGPILRVLFGPGTGPQVTLAALAVYYTTLLALLVGLRAVSQTWTDIMVVYGRGRLTTLTKIRARASLPYMFVGLQISAPAAFLGAMIGEFTGAERGLGVLTLRAMRGLDTDATWTLALLSATIAMLAYGAIGWLGRRATGHPPVILLSASTGTRRPPAMRAAETIAIVALVVILWQLSMDAFELNRFFAKRPGDVLAFLSDAGNRATVMAALGETLAFA